jgi:hypothetical protein
VNAPAWLTDLLSILMLALGFYSLWRLLIARAWGRTTDYETDALHLLAGVATAGVIAGWARTLPRGAWTVVFAAAGVYFAVRAARARGDSADRRRLLGATGCCAVLLYMFTAGVGPSTMRGSTAGQVTMAGMPGMIFDQTVTYPSIGLIFVVGLAFAAVVVVNRIGARPAPRPAPVIGGPDDGAPVLIALAPRSAQLSRVLLLLVLGYAILTKLV